VFVRVVRPTIVGVALVALAAGAAALRKSAEQRAPASIDTAYDVPPVPGDVARPLAFGFRSLVADFTFLEAIQVLAPRRSDWKWQEYGPVDRRLYRLLDYSVELDPKFAGAYRFAGAALPHETVDGKALGVLPAVNILEQGVRERPDDWHVPFLLGFLQSYYLRDYAGAARSFAVSARAPHAPPWVGLLATRVAAQGGTIDVALQLAQAMLAQANEEETRKAWQERVESLTMERDLRAIEAAAQRFRGDRGTYPSSLRELIAARYLAREPQEPHGGRYILRPDGTARSTAAERLHVYGESAHVEVH
jgi:hypothetical protein